MHITIWVSLTLRNESALIVSRDLKADTQLRIPFNCQECCLIDFFRSALSYRWKICSTIFALSCKLQNLNKLLSLVLLFWGGPGFEVFCYLYPNKNLTQQVLFSTTTTAGDPIYPKGSSPLAQVAACFLQHCLETT